jgi:hypothetical protein
MSNKKSRFLIPIATLGSCEVNPTPIPVLKTDDMETTMNTNTVNTNDVNARRAINGAIFETAVKVEREAYKTFGYADARRPKSAEELVEWIKAGDIILPSERDGEDYDPADYRFESFLGLTFPPKIKKDREGLDKHMENFNKDKKALELEVQVLDPEKALANFKTFERKWIH